MNSLLRFLFYFFYILAVNSSSGSIVGKSISKIVLLRVLPRTNQMKSIVMPLGSTQTLA